MENHENVIISSTPIFNPEEYFNPLEITDEELDALINRLEK